MKEEFEDIEELISAAETVEREAQNTYEATKDKERFPATHILVEEHNIIKEVLDILEKGCEILKSGELKGDFFLKAADFFRNYADKYHHGKEEDILFDVLMKKGAQHLLDIIEALKKDHLMGRDYVSKIQEFGARYRSGEDVLPELLHNSKGYISLLREHIIKEDEGLFPEMDRVLTENEQKDLARRFEEVELSGDGPSKYLNLAKELKNIAKPN